MGGSTAACIQIATNACNQDLGCFIMCRISGWRCTVAITLACFISCNNAITTPTP
ncbi:MAG: hypothetical protein L3J14_04925 [Flavobacteriaceae bacterium]|nr:hypothetical protein [Flavobacteriaceae bacterium]